MHVRSAVVAVLLLALSACGGGSAAPVAPSTSGVSPAGTPSATPTGAGATPGDKNPLAGLDACSLLDEKTVQELTGESVRFVTGGSGHTCFWSALGANAYVDIDLGWNPGGLSAFNFGVGQACSVSPVAGVGTEAKGGTCPPDPQRKVYLLAFDRGVIVTLLVNEPSRPLEPSDLAATVNTVLQRIR